MPAPKGLAALALVDAAEAGRKLRAAIRSTGGDLAKASDALGVHRATLALWLARFPGGKGTDGKRFANCREWLDATYRQRNDPRPIGRRRKSTDGQTKEP